MNKFNLPNLGFGLGLRSKHMKHVLENRPMVDWFEVISENYMDSQGQPRKNLRQIRENYPVVMHGVSLSIGSTDPLNFTYLERLKNLASDIEPAWISDHLCWTGINGKNSHDLLPVPLTEEALNHIVQRIGQVQDFLGRRILLENPSSYLTFKADNIPEYEFMAELAKRADCGLLLDVNNIYVASFNHRLDPRKYIDSIPMQNVVQIHLAGHTHKGNHIVDTHDGHVVDEVWDLYAYAIARAGFVPSTMVEWDSKIPEFEVLEQELKKAKAFANSEQKTVDRQFAVHSSQVTLHSNHNVLSLQQNLQTAIHSGDVDGATAETWIVEKENFSPQEQLSVYTNGYRLRLYDLVMGDYEVTAQILGNEMPKLVREYISKTPSEFYNASNFSAQFAGWLQGQTIEKTAQEMVILEKAIADCYNLPEDEPLTQNDLQGVATEDFTELKLRPRTAAFLLEFEQDVHSYMRGFYRKEKAEIAKKKLYLFVYRHNSQTYRLPLEQGEFEMLKLLAEGKKIGDAFAALEGKVTPEKIQEWFGRWMREGVLGK
jgi:hypothetical protein